MNVLVVKKKYGLFETFEGAKNANRCLPYDYVSFTDKGCSLLQRNEYPILVGILGTTGPKYGFTSHGNPIYLCKPLDERYPSFYVGSKIKDIISNKLIIFKFDSWPDNSEFPKGIFVDLLGNCGDILTESNASLLKANGYIWPKILDPIIHPSFNGRMRLSGYTFNIDPNGCRDIDDCITIWDNKMAISIADVSAWVEVNPWMKKAEYMGTSLYQNGTCVKPMFPKLLSEDLMSLVEGQERLAYSLIISFGETITYEFKETIVQVNKSYTYESVYNDTNFNYPILKDYVYRLSGLETNDSHKWVEILMLYYNNKSGDILKQKGSGILRSQKGVNIEMAKLFEEFSNSYNYLCYESAKYCLPNEDTVHSQLNLQNYAHASSPIRRYVDIINQFALKEKQFSYESIDRFNTIQKLAKNYERDLIYIDLYKNKKILEGIVINSDKVFVPILKKIINLKNIYDKNSSIQLTYYMNPQGIKWKEKVLFQIIR
jgi:exosome complex exonuclease DIS3/RRP44